MDILTITIIAHSGQLRRDNEAYILHPIRVAKNAARFFSIYGNNEDDENYALMIGLLHDVVEDCLDVDDIYLKNHGVHHEVIQAVYDITSLGPYEAKLQQVRDLFCSKPFSIQAVVKMYDIQDNTTNFASKKKLQDYAKILNVYNQRIYKEDPKFKLKSAIRRLAHKTIHNIEKLTI